MIFQLIVLLVILLLTGYLATQGWLSATLIFICATFGSIIAGGLYEPFSGMFSWTPNYSHGVTYLLIFFLAFGGLRFGVDMYIKQNIHLQVWVDRAGGGVVGLLAAMVIAGTLVIGICMMPLSEAILGENWGWNRYPGGLRDKEEKLWLNPDGFVTWIYEQSLGRSMGGSYGGDYTFAQAHPNFGQELWGYRHRMPLTSTFTMPPKLLEEPKSWKYVGAKWADEGKDEYVVRMVVRKGDSSGESADKDHNFRATESQIRLVSMNPSGEAVQVYPSGYMDKGVVEVNKDPKINGRPKLFRDTGRSYYTVEDFTDPPGEVAASTPEQAMIDWVFEVPTGYEPAFLEVKGLARRNVAKLNAPPPVPLAQEWPPRRWERELFTMVVTAHSETKLIPGLQVYVIPVGIERKAYGLENTVSKASERLEEMLKEAKDATEPFLPSRNELKTPDANARNARLGSDPFSWDSTIIPSIIWSSMDVGGGGGGNVAKIIDALDQKVKPVFKNISKGTILSTDNSGMTEKKRYISDTYCLIAWYKDEKNTLYVWYPRITAEKLKDKTFNLITGEKGVKNSPTELDLTPNFVWPRRQ